MITTQLDRIFGTNTDKEVNGVDCTYYGAGGSVVVKLARAGGKNAKLQRVAEEKFRPLRRAIANDQLPNKIAEQNLQEAFAECVVLGWNLVAVETGEPVPCTPDNVLEVFRAFPDFWQFVHAEATKLANYQDAALEDAAKN